MMGLCFLQVQAMMGCTHPTDYGRWARPITLLFAGSSNDGLHPSYGLRALGAAHHFAFFQVQAMMGCTHPTDYGR
jgi:hypothetical protein